MAGNDKLFVVKNGLRTQNTEYLSPDRTNTINLEMLDSDTLSWEGDSGQLFSITDSLSGTIFSVNDISGIPSIEVDDDGTIRLAEFAGNVLVGTNTDDGTNKLQVAGSVSATSFVAGVNNLQIIDSNSDSLIESSSGSNLIINASSGNVGIGDSTPNDKLSVSGHITTNGNKVYLLGDSTSPNPSFMSNDLLQFNSAGGVTFRNLATQTGGELTIETRGDNDIILSPARYVGVGTATPSSKLDVNGTITATSFSGDGSSVTNVNADLLDGQNGTYYLDYNNFTNKPSLYNSSDFDTDFASKTTDNLSEGSNNLYYTNARVDARIGDGTLTVSGASGLTGSGTFSANQSTNQTIDISHADTSSQGSVNNSGSTVIQDITLDGFGHVTNLNSKNLSASDVGALGVNDKAADSNELDGLNSSQFLRSDTNDTMSGRLEMSNVLDMNNNDIEGVNQIFHNGDTDTFIDFHAFDQFRVVTGGSERLEVRNDGTSITNDLDVTGEITADKAVFTGTSSVILPSGTEAERTEGPVTLNDTADDAISSAGVGLEPEFSQFDVTVNHQGTNRQLGDVDGSGFISGFDAFRVSQFIAGVLTDQAVIDYIEQTMIPFMEADLATYGQYLDGNPIAGMIRFNTETSQFEGYNGTAWVNLS